MAVMTGTRDPARLSLARSAAGFFLAATAESMFPALAYAVSDDLDLSYGHQGLAMGTLTAGLASGNMIGAAVGKRHSVRSSLLAAFMVAAAGCLAVSMAGDVWQLAGGELLTGIGAGMYFPVGLCWTHRLVEGRRLSTVMSMWGSAFPLGLAAASVLGPATGGDWRMAFRLVAASCIAWGLLQLRPALAETYDATPLPSSTAPGPAGARAAGAVLIGVAAAFGYYGAALFLPTFLVDTGSDAAAVALLIVLARCCSFPAKLAVGLLADHFGSVSTGLVVVGLMVASLVGVAGVSLFRFGGAAIYLLASGSLFPLFYVLVARWRWRGQQILAVGLGRALLLLIGVAASSLTGYVADVSGRTVGLAVALPPLLAVLVLGVLILRPPPGGRTVT